ncbi:hypothetical protein DHEL01_v206816 [Diaporthe helianthi]|uniref:Uncharacterized protein n=1 Tax=Diaporthe helianthi TaxID=158607 RepID=A0A2P5HX04_DIAHE|nr:hypothetical protein DHEL01_v206816 [Diaporthe helianthi]
MAGMNNQKLTNEAMLAEAKAFQREVTRGKDHRGHSGTPSQKPGVYGSGAHTSARSPRGFSGQPFAQNLATPQQFFGRQNHPTPSAPQTPTVPAVQHPDSRPVDDFEPMQVDPNPAVPEPNKAAAQPTGRGLVGSRWATSASANMPSRVSVPVAPAYAAIETGKAGATTNKATHLAPNFPSSSQNTTLDTPEMPGASKGLLGSRWAAGTFPASPSSMTMKFPDPSTLEPVYRSEDWLSDLSAEHEEFSIKTRSSSVSQPTRQAPLTQPAAAPTAAETMKPRASESQQPGQNPATFSAASQKLENAAVQAASDAVAPKQSPDTNSGSSDEFGKATPSAQAASKQGGVFNDSAFKDWYNSQFMNRKA